MLYFIVKTTEQTVLLVTLTFVSVLNLCNVHGQMTLLFCSVQEQGIKHKIKRELFFQEGKLSVS